MPVALTHAFVGLRACLPSHNAPTAGTEWAVHCHAYLHWECYQPGLENMSKPVSPLYFLKLKKGGLAAMVGGVSSPWCGTALWVLGCGLGAAGWQCGQP